MAINEMVRYINTSIITGNKPEFLSNILEGYKKVYLAQDGASKDVESYSAQSFTKKLRTFFNEQQLNTQAKSALINQFVPPIFCLYFAFTAINFRGMLHHVCDVVYDENMSGPIRTRKCRSTN